MTVALNMQESSGILLHLPRITTRNMIGAGMGHQQRLMRKQSH